MSNSIGISQELEDLVLKAHRLRSGGYGGLTAEFLKFCQINFAYRPDVRCASCMMKYTDKIAALLLKEDDQKKGN